MNKILRMVIGSFLCSISLSVIIIYSNLLLYGYSFFEFIINLFILVEFYYMFIVLFLIVK